MNKQSFLELATLMIIKQSGLTPFFEKKLTSKDNLYNFTLISKDNFKAKPV